MRTFTEEEIKAMEIVKGIFRSEDRSFISENCPKSAGEQSPLYTADCAADVLEELIKTNNKQEWNLPSVEVTVAAVVKMNELIKLLADNGQCLGFDEDSDTLFIAPKGLQWDNTGAHEDATKGMRWGKAGDNQDDFVPVTAEELEYRSQNYNLCSGKICFVHPSDSSEYLEKCGLRKKK